MYEQKFMSNVNYPLVAPQRLKHRHIITAPSGYMIKIAIPSNQAGNECKNTSYMEVSFWNMNNTMVKAIWHSETCNLFKIESTLQSIIRKAHTFIVNRCYYSISRIWTNKENAQVMWDAIWQTFKKWFPISLKSYF